MANSLKIGISTQRRKDAEAQKGKERGGFIHSLLFCPSAPLRPCVVATLRWIWHRKVRAKLAKNRKGRQEFEGEQERFAVLGDLCANSLSSPSSDGVSDPAENRSSAVCGRPPSAAQDKIKKGNVGESPPKPPVES